MGDIFLKIQLTYQAIEVNSNNRDANALSETTSNKIIL